MSINGLVEEANQPLRSNNCILICNGEVYNHESIYKTLGIENSSKSDCNAILDLYIRHGIEYTLECLDGVYGFILIDFRESEPKIFVARDPMGVRPLYIAQSLGTSSDKTLFGIASELVSIHKCITDKHDKPIVSQFPAGSYVQYGVHWLDSVTPTIDYAKKYFGENHTIIDNVDKKAYLSALSISNSIVVTCDSSSMISEAALTGKPIYVANILPRKNDKRFQEFRNLFRELNIIRNLGEEEENWSYQKLDETNRVANIIKQKINS